MSKKSPPIGLSLIICDTVIVDENTKKKSLIGLFNRIMSPTFPCHHPELHVFVSLTNGHGKCGFTLRCVDAGGKSIANIEGGLEVGSPNQVIEADFNFKSLAFPKPGQYSFEFLCDGAMILHRRFVVEQIPEDKK